MLSAGKVLVGATHQFAINGATYQGQLDTQGQLEHEISTLATKGRLVIKAGQQQFEYELNFVSAIPADITTGTKMRLKNLGYVE